MELTNLGLMEAPDIEYDCPYLREDADLRRAPVPTHSPSNKCCLLASDHGISSLDSQGQILAWGPVTPSSLLLFRLELSDTPVYEPGIRSSGAHPQPSQQMLCAVERKWHM